MSLLRRSSAPILFVVWQAPSLAMAQEPVLPDDPVAQAESFDDLAVAVADAPGASAARSAAAPVTPPAASGGFASAMNPALSAILDVAFAYFSEEDPPQRGHHDPKRSGFNWQGLELSLTSSVDPYLRLDVHLGFCDEGAHVEEAYATTLALPAGLQARFGKFLTRFGRLNATHMHTWNFADQPFVLGRLFGGEGERGLGAELSLMLPLSWSVELVGSATEASGEDSARSFLGAEERPMGSLLDPLYTTAVKQFFPLSDDWSLAWGLSANFGPHATGDDHRAEIYGTDLYLRFRPLRRPEPRVVSLHSEWFYRRRQIAGGLLQDYGQFTEVLWRFEERWATAARYELGSPSYDLGGAFALDPLDPGWTNHRHRMSASLSFYPTEFSRFRWQWGGDRVTPERTIVSTFLTAEVSAGAHGAHSF